MVFQQAITDAQLCGARFVDLSGNSFGVTGYDLGEIIIFSKKQQDPWFILTWKLNIILAHNKSTNIEWYSLHKFKR